MTAASARRDTEIFTTAGETFLTRGARLWCWISAIGDVIVCGVVCVACGGLPAAGGFSAQTKGDRARVAPRPKPIAAERFRFSQGEPARSFPNSLISSPPKRSLCRRNAAELERIAVQLMPRANRRLTHELIRRNFGAGRVLHTASEAITLSPCVTAFRPVCGLCSNKNRSFFGLCPRLRRGRAC